MISVTVGGLTFTNLPVVAADGNIYALVSLDGIRGGSRPGVRLANLSRPQYHGTFGERGWRPGRSVILDGVVVCPTVDAADAAELVLSALLADGQFDDLVVTTALTLTTRVQLGAAPTVDWSPGCKNIPVQFPLYAPDPLLYGTRMQASTEFPDLVGGLEFDLFTDGAGTDLGYLDFGLASTTGRLSLTNAGTADAPVQFTIAGPVDASGFYIETVGTGALLAYEGTVPSGSTLVLDGATGAVLLDGADRSMYLTYRDWAVVAHGASVEYAFQPLGSRTTAELTSSLAPAYW